MRLLTLINHYCDLAVAVDYYDTGNQERNERNLNLISEILSSLSFINSEISEQNESLLSETIAIATENKHFLENILRDKPHRLHPETERVLAALSRTINAPYQIYNMTKLADIKFPPFSAAGKEYPLSYTLFENNYEYEQNTDIRRAAFAAFF